MQTASRTVKSKGEDLGQVEFPVYESIDEFVSGVGDAVGLNIINAAVETNAKNDYRRLKTTGTSIRAKDWKALLENVPQDQLAALADAIKSGDRAAVAGLLQLDEEEPE